MRRPPRPCRPPHPRPVPREGQVSGCAGRTGEVGSILAPSESCVSPTVPRGESASVGLGRRIVLWHAPSAVPLTPSLVPPNLAPLPPPSPPSSIPSIPTSGCDRAGAMVWEPRRRSYESAGGSSPSSGGGKSSPWMTSPPSPVSTGSPLDAPDELSVAGNAQINRVARERVFGHAWRPGGDGTARVRHVRQEKSEWACGARASVAHRHDNRAQGEG